MRIRALRHHVDSRGESHVPGDEYEETKANAEEKNRAGITVEATEAKKAAPLENKKAPKPKNKAE